MSLKTRIIPTLLYDGTSLVKGQRFDHSRRIGDLMQAVRVHMMRDVDEMVLLFVDTPMDLSVVARVADECRVPLAVGGGVDSLELVRDVLAAGADKVVLTSYSPIIEAATARFGSSTVVVTLDAYDDELAKHTAMRIEGKGTGEIILQSVPRDGTLTGYAIDTLREVCASVNIPVVASGGAGTYQHMLEAIEAGASAVAAGAMWQFTEATPKGAKRYLREHGVEVRM